MFTFIYEHWFDIVFVFIIYIVVYSIVIVEQEEDQENFDIQMKPPRKGSNTNTTSAGFCQQHHGNSVEIDKQCKKLSKNTCAHASCCVYHGEKEQCMAGDEHGLTFLTDDKGMDISTDYYYYMGKPMGKPPQ